MKGHAEANMMWEGLRVAVRDILFLGVGFYVWCSLMTVGELLP